MIQLVLPCLRDWQRGCVLGQLLPLPASPENEGDAGWRARGRGEVAFQENAAKLGMNCVPRHASGSLQHRFFGEKNENPNTVVEISLKA